MKKKIILGLSILLSLSIFAFAASDKPQKSIPTDTSMQPVAVIYIQNPDGTYSMVNSNKRLPIDVESSNTPTINVVTLTNADTEYSATMPANTKKFTIQARENVDIRIAFVTGKVATPTDPYLTLKAGNVWWEDHIDSETTVYFASSSAGTYVEILIWE